jgi:hypothetical protein
MTHDEGGKCASVTDAAASELKYESCEAAAEEEESGEIELRRKKPWANIKGELFCLIVDFQHVILSWEEVFGS